MFASSISRMRALVNALSVRMRTCAAGVAARLAAHLLQRDRQQADRHLLAGGGDDVELARIGVGRDLAARAPSRRLVSPAIADTHDDQLVALRVEVRDAPRDVLDALDGADRGAAVFLDDQGHCVSHAKARRARSRARGTRASRWCRRSRTSWTARRGSASCAPRSGTKSRSHLRIDVRRGWPSAARSGRASRAR